MLPFTPEQFFAVFRAYNEAVWPAQWVLLALAAACLVLVRFPSRLSDRAVSLVLALLWGWMAIAYHLAFFTAINPAAYVFAGLFLAGAAAFAWSGVVRGDLRFDRHGPRAFLGWMLVAAAMVAYPLLGHALGHHYPYAPTLGAPCPTTLFTLGVLCFAGSGTPRYVYAAPILWSLIAGVSATTLGAAEDLLLLAAGVVSASLLAGPSPFAAVPLDTLERSRS